MLCSSTSLFRSQRKSKFNWRDQTCLSKGQNAAVLIILWLIAISLNCPDMAMHTTFGAINGCFVPKPCEYLMKMLSECILILICAGASFYFLKGAKMSVQSSASSSIPSPSGDGDTLLLVREHASPRRSTEIQMVPNKVTSTSTPRVKITKVGSIDPENSAFFKKSMKLTFSIIILYMFTTILMFILFNWFANQMKFWFKDFYNLDLFLYELFQQILLLIYSIHKPIIFLLSRNESQQLHPKKNYIDFLARKMKPFLRTKTFSSEAGAELRLETISITHF